MQINSNIDIIVKCLTINVLTFIKREKRMNKELLDSAVRLTLKVNRTHRHLIEERVRAIGFHRTAHMTLMHLAKNDKSPSQRELAERFSITPAAVTGILKKLERDGYITRTAGQDTRFNEIAITDEGRRVVEHSRETFYEVDRAMFEGFSDSELESYLALLSRVCDNLENKKEENI